MMVNMEAMRLRIEGHEYNAGRHSNYRGRGRGRAKGRAGCGGRGCGRIPQQRRIGGQYCSTHGNCAHDSADCENPGSNHNEAATFANMMGGSTANCDWHGRNEYWLNRDYKIKNINNSSTFVSPPTLICKLQNQKQQNASQIEYTNAKHVNDINNTSTHTPEHLHPNAYMTSHKPKYTATNNYYAALVDTAATHNYLEDEVTKFCDKLKPAYGPSVKVANGNIITPTQHGTLRLSENLSKEARHSYVVDKLKTGSLISIRKLCDDDCIAIFSRYNFNILKMIL